MAKSVGKSRWDEIKSFETAHEFIAFEVVVFIEIQVSGESVKETNQRNPAFKDGDCGIFVIKYTEFLLSNEPVANVNAQRMEYFHHKLVCELYYYGL
ncbi:hypothetical protein TorRG33x02_036620 [Trema orientale]|uniref:Ubiquitin-like protease family profile domain-containing protein n=1 Tax=Trema orientale TaxID=63057 RepID=A0A2P5FRZ6_TREOI|nr:hypothetical protein TorRG33x02_036620 [Trema orientale]